MNWKNWAMGLAWAFLTGLGTGVTFVLVDPEHFNFSTGWRSLIGISIAFGIVSAASYLKKSEPPADGQFVDVKKTTAVLLVLGLGLTLSACANNPPIANTVNAEHITVVSVDAVIQAEATAFKAGAYDNATHQTYVSALLKISQSEKALNDALKTWDQASGQPAPAVVALALNSLRTIVADLTPLIPTNSTIGALVASATTAINLITGVK